MRRPRELRAGIAGAAVHTLNNGLGVLMAVEDLLARAHGAPECLAKAQAALEAATGQLSFCVDALSLAALSREDAATPGRTPVDELREMGSQLCRRAELVPACAAAEGIGGEIALDGELVRWIVSCAIAALRETVPRRARLAIALARVGEAVELRLEAQAGSGPNPAAGQSPFRGRHPAALALAGRKALLAAAGVRITQSAARAARGAGLRVRFPLAVEKDGAGLLA